MRSGASAWMIVLAAVLAGCAIGPDYKRPPVAEPEMFRWQATAEAASLADAPWWEVFQDPVLRDLIHEALRNNYDVRIAAARVQEARAGFVATRSDLFPSLDYDASVGRSNATPGLLGKPGRQAPTISNFYSATLAMSWELDIWGRIRRATEAARANLLATEDARRGVWLTLVSDLAQTYFVPAHLRPVPGSLPGRSRLEAGDGSSRRRPRRGRGDHPADRERHRGQRESDERSAGKEPRPDSPRHTDV